MLDNLQNFDEQIDQDLVPVWQEVSKHSKALVNSLKDCFVQARKSQRFEYIYELAKTDKNLSPEEITKKATEKYSEQDFMLFRKYVRLLRACTLSAGGECSKKIKESFKRTFFTERLYLAYELSKKIN